MANFTARQKGVIGVKTFFVGGSSSNAKPVAEALNSILAKSINLNHEMKSNLIINALLHGKITSTGKPFLPLLNKIETRTNDANALNEAKKRPKSAKTNDDVAPPQQHRRSTR